MDPLLWLQALMLALLVAATAAILRRLRKLEGRLSEQKRTQKAQYAQTEALLGLYAELQPTAALPATRGWAASPDFLLHLVRHVRERHPQRVLECSCGASTVVIARMLQRLGGGHVWSLEHEPRFAEATRRELARHGLETFATVVDAPLVEVSAGGHRQPWYDPAAIPAGEFDLLVVDGPPAATAPMARYPAGPMLMPRMRRQAAIFLDDAGRRDEQASAQAWQRLAPDWRLEELWAEKGLVKLTRD